MADVQYIENLQAPETTADDIPYVSVQNGLLSLVLTRTRHDNSNGGAAARVVVGRVTLPLSVAEVVTANLQKYLADYRTNTENAANSATVN